MSRVRVSIRPSNYTRKHPKPRGNQVAGACVYLNDPATAHECQRNRQKGALTPSPLGATDPSNQNGDGGVCTCVCTHRACTRRACTRRACLRDVFAIYDNMSARLIMIKIKIIILFHTNQ